jgi:RNA polymerase sigma factor (sigma-70 family)
VRAAKSNQNLDDLANRMRALDEESFHEFAAFFGPRFKSLFIRKGLTESDAEDLAVSSITDIALKIDKYRITQDGSFKAWVYKLACHCLVDWWRSRRATIPLSDDLNNSSVSTDETESNLEVILAVRDSMAQLSEVDQTLIKLRNLEMSYSYEEIGERLGIRAGTARVRHSRALKRLKKLLEEDSRIQRLIARHLEHKLGGRHG